MKSDHKNIYAWITCVFQQLYFVIFSAYYRCVNINRPSGSIFVPLCYCNVDGVERWSDVTHKNWIFQEKPWTIIFTLVTSLLFEQNLNFRRVKWFVSYVMPEWGLHDQTFPPSVRFMGRGNSFKTKVWVNILGMLILWV